MARTVLNGMIAARPIPTPDSQNRPLVANRTASKAIPSRAATSAAQRAETFNSLIPCVSNSATAFQTCADGMGFWSVTRYWGPSLRNNR